MMRIKQEYRQEWWESLHGCMGSAHSIDGSGPEETRVEALHRVVEEVTGKRVERKERRIGFL